MITAKKARKNFEKSCHYFVSKVSRGLKRTIRKASKYGKNEIEIYIHTILNLAFDGELSDSLGAQIEYTTWKSTKKLIPLDVYGKTYSQLVKDIICVDRDGNLCLSKDNAFLPSAFRQLLDYLRSTKMGYEVNLDLAKERMKISWKFDKDCRK